jgi:hypothetical protein
MRVAVALLFVLAACAIFALQASHCIADQAGNQTGNNASLNHTTAVNNSTHAGNNVTNTTGNQTTNQTNQTQQDNNNSTNSTDDEDQYGYDYNDEYNNYYDNSSDEDYNDTDYYQDTDDGISGTGAITGVILSSFGSHAVPNANVGLYDEDDNLADVPENPQLSSNGTGNNGGTYMFYDVPYGHYTVKAEKGGVEFFAVVNLSTGTATANVVLPEYVETEPAYQEPGPPEAPTPAPKPYRYFLPITVGKMPAAAPPDEGLPFGLAAVGGICALYLFTRRNGKA